MTDPKHSASTPTSASTVLPRAEVIQLPTARTRPAEPGSFTKTSIRKMHCAPGQAEAFFWDAGCRGLGIRALKSKRRSWIFQYRDEHGRTRRIALGDVSAVELEEARDAARRTAASVAQGSNPAVDRKKKRTAGTMLEVIEAYLASAKERLRPRSYTETERHLRTHAAALHHERAETVGRRDITALLERLAKKSGHVAANRVRATLSALWSWGLRTGLIETEGNPVAFTVRYPEKARERVLGDSELKAIWHATNDNDDYLRIARLCLLTGCRREEIAGLRWEEVHTDKIVIGADRMKGKQAHEIALLPMIAAALPPRPAVAFKNWYAQQVYNPSADIALPEIAKYLIEEFGDNWLGRSNEEILHRLIWRFVIRQHQTMSYERGFGGSAPLFHVDGTIIIGASSDFTDPRALNPRLGSALQILTDLGLVAYDDDGGYSRTAEGDGWLAAELKLEGAP